MSDTDRILALLKQKAVEILEEGEYVGPREIGTLTDAIIKIAKKESEDEAKLAEVERETSGLAIFPAMPSSTDGSFKF